MKSQVESLSGVTSSIVRNDEFLTTKELMKLLKIRHKQTIYKLIAEGMPVIIAGQRNYRFIKQDVISFLKDESQKRFKKGSGQPDGD